MWLRDEEPEHYRAARWLAPVGGHLTGWLTGEVVQDHANASSTLLYDLHARAWNDELVGHAGLDAAQLPPIRAVARRSIGTLRAGGGRGARALDAAARSIVGTGDEHAGRARRGRARAGHRRRRHRHRRAGRGPVARRRSSTTSGLVETHAHAVDGVLLVENPGFVSGGSTRWWAATQRIPQARGVRARRAGAARRGRRAVPPRRCRARWRRAGTTGCAALRRAGAQPRRRAPRPRGARGLHVRAARHRRPLRARSSLGGDEIRVVGGGARSPLWLQIKADVTGRPVRPVAGRLRDERGRRDARRRRGGQLRRPARPRPRPPCARAPSRCCRDPATADVYERRLRRATGGCSTAIESALA